MNTITNQQNCFGADKVLAELTSCRNKEVILEKDFFFSRKTANKQITPLTW